MRGNALIAVPPSGTDGDEEGMQQQEIIFDGKWSLHRLQSFFKGIALEHEVKPKPAEEKVKEEEEKEDEKKKKMKTEL